MVLTGRLLRDITVDLYGREQLEASWHADSWMRANVPRLLCRTAARGARWATASAASLAGTRSTKPHAGS